MTEESVFGRSVASPSLASPSIETGSATPSGLRHGGPAHLDLKAWANPFLGWPDPPQHDYWRPGSPDCPADIKAGNGELHTMRCKTCGLDDPRNPVCSQPQPDGAEAVSPREFDGESLGKRIKLLRALRRMSLEELGKGAGLTKSHVWELEKGRSRNPTVNAVWGLSRALSVSPAALLGLDDAMPPIHPLALEIAGMVDRALRAPEGVAIKPEGTREETLGEAKGSTEPNTSQTEAGEPVKPSEEKQ